MVNICANFTSYESVNRDDLWNITAIANKVRDERDKETSLQVCKQKLAEQVEFNFAQVMNYDSWLTHTHTHKHIVIIFYR